jgi:hypothetical protein
MKVSTFIVKIWRWASVLLVVGALGWTYATFSEMVAFRFDSDGKPSEYLNKETVFYISMALLILNNVAIGTVAKQIHHIPVGLLPIPNRSKWEKNKPALFEVLTNWITSLIASINTIIALSLFTLSTVNGQSKYDIFDFSWLSYLSIALLVVIMLAPPVFLMQVPISEETETE